MSLFTSSIRAGCKINLYLHVGQRLANGYHELDTLLLPLERPCDLLRIAPSGKLSGKADDEAAGGTQGGLRVRFFQTGQESGMGLKAEASDHKGTEDEAKSALRDSPFPFAPVPGIDPCDNTLTSAYAWFTRQTGFAPALDITVIKGIPHGAGLGGGSSDAAALLGFLQDAAAREGRAPVPQAELLAGAASVGADVPFFLLGGPARAGGIGEKLVPCANPRVGLFLALVCPNLHISTAWAFAALDEQRDSRRKKTCSGLTSGGHKATTSLVQRAIAGNDFESVVFTACPELGILHRQLRDLGAEGVGLSGTGSALFGWFREEKNAMAAAKALANNSVKVYIQKPSVV